MGRPGTPAPPAPAARPSGQSHPDPGNWAPRPGSTQARRELHEIDKEREPATEEAGLVRAAADGAVWLVEDQLVALPLDPPVLEAGVAVHHRLDRAVVERGAWRHDLDH